MQVPYTLTVFYAYHIYVIHRRHFNNYEHLLTLCLTIFIL